MADTTIGVRLEAEDNVSPKVKNIKDQLKAAQAEVVSLTEKFGATSKQAADAAKKAAELKDKIGDAKSLVDAFNPDTKFRAFGASISTVVGGFTALTGAMGLLGVESEQVQKTLLKVQSALALSQGIAQLQEGMQAFKNLGSVIMNTLGKSGVIGIAIAGVTALGLALAGVFDGANVKTKELNKSLKELQKGEVDAAVEVNKLKNSFKQAELGIISKEKALKEYNEGMGLTVGQAKDLNEAEKLTAENADNYIKVQGLKAQANYILQKSSQLAAEAAIHEAEILKEGEGFGLRGRATEIAKERIAEQKKAADELQNLVAGINSQISAASSGFKTPGSTGGKATTPGGKAKVAELDESKKFQLEYDYWERLNADKQAAELLAIKAKANKDKLTQEQIDQQAMADMVIGIDNFVTNEAKILSGVRTELQQKEHDAKLAFAAAGADILTATSQLLGEQTAAGKVLAVAAASISTYLAINKTLAAFAGLPIPGYAIAQAIATGIFGLVQVKKILSVQVPGKGGSGSVPNIGSASAPLTPQLATATNTRLDQAQLNQIGNAAARSFVLESDISNNQERVRRLNRAARIG